MTWNDFQFLLVQAIFVYLAIQTLIDWNRQRTRVRLDSALMFSAIALLACRSAITTLPGAPEWLNLLPSIALAAHPLLALHLVAHHRPVPRPIYVTAAAGFSYSVIVILLLPTFEPFFYFLPGFAYFAFVEGYAALAFWKGARRSAGVSRWRQMLAAVGSALIALALLTIGVRLTALPDVDFLHSLSLAMAALAGISFYFGFASPRWLRQAWQQAEVHRFLRRLSSRSAINNRETILTNLREAATGVVASSATLIACRDDADGLLRIVEPTYHPLSGRSIDISSGAIGTVWRKRRPLRCVEPGQLGGLPELADLLVPDGAVLIAPIATAAKTMGLMLVFTPSQSLFPGDDLALLALLGEQTAVAYQYVSLLASERRARRHAETLVHTSAHLNAHLELERALPIICEQTARILNVPIVGINLLDESGTHIRLASSYGLPEKLVVEMDSVPRHRLAALVPEDNAIVIHEDIRRLHHLPNPDVYRETDIRTVVRAILRHNNRFVGHLVIATVGEVRRFSRDELTLLQGIASQATLALQNARLFREVQQHAQQLERRVSERTADLQTRNNELDAFAHTVAHDLKSPVHNIVGYIDLVLDTENELDDEQRLCLNFARRGAYRIEHIINALLLLARVRDEEVESTAVRMSGVVKRAWERLECLAAEHQARLELPESWPTALGYECWIEEIWVNYLSNAIKYGGPKPTIRVGASPVEGGMIRFWVEDEGPGLSQDDATRLFKPFTQLTQANGRRGEGNGLGLSIVQRIVTRLGGEVGVDSDVGRGSSFWFSLPAHYEQKMAVNGAAVNGHVPAPPPLAAESSALRAWLASV